MSRALLFLQHFPGGAAPGRATGGGAACGFPGGAAPGRATGWWCGLWVSRRRCAWPGYWLVVRPVGFPAALRLAGLLAGGASCGMSSPGEAFMPTPGRFTGVRCEKSPYFRTSSHLEYGGEGGGLTRFARPCGAARLLRSRSVQLAAPVVEPRSGVLIPPVRRI